MKLQYLLLAILGLSFCVRAEEEKTAPKPCKIGEKSGQMVCKERSKLNPLYYISGHEKCNCVVEKSEKTTTSVRSGQTCEEACQESGKLVGKELKATTGVQQCPGSVTSMIGKRCTCECEPVKKD